MVNSDVNRINRLREQTFTCGFSYDEFAYWFYKSLRSDDGHAAYAARIADALYDMYGNVEPFIAEDELIAGRLSQKAFSAEEAAEFRLYKEYAEKIMSAQHGQGSHMAIDYDLLLSKGFEGVMADIAEKRAALDLYVPDDVKKDIFYASCERTLAGVIRYAERYADEAERQAANCGDETRKAELLTMAGNFRSVPRKPAQTFWEAVQSAHFVTFCLSAKPFKFHNHLYQLGRVDRYLLPYYEKDIAEGKITKEFAQTLLDCLGIMMNARIPRGLAAGWMVGGRDKDGRVVSNDLTRMGMETVRNIRLVYPGVGFCRCEDTPDEDLRLACEILGEGHSHPAIFNDDVISEGLRFYGMPEAESHDYIHSTCVEITPCASSNVWVASPYMNLTQKLLDVLTVDYADMDALLTAYWARVEDGIRENAVRETLCRVERTKYSVDPLLSCFVNDCLEKGRDIEDNGARYNWTMPSFVGLSNVADGLAVMEKLIFERKELDFETLRGALKSDFDGAEPLRQKLLSAVPKYGNDDDYADKYVILLTERLTKAMEKYQTRKDNIFAPSLFCWIRHDSFGRETGASPDGRKAGFPLGDGSGPAQGREQNGPTAAILSSTKWEHRKFIGGVAVNMKFSKKMFGEGSIDKLTALVKTYLQRGGFELQINVVDRDTLLKAKENPEAYRDIIVRIGGYSDYFVKLSDSMKEEVLARTEYSI